MAVPNPSNPTDLPTSSDHAPPWIELPQHLTENILNRLGAVEIMNSAERVCTTWKRVCDDPLMWRAIDVRKPESGDKEDKRTYEIICCRAVDRSQGGVQNLRIENFGSESLFQYISQRLGQVRCLVFAAGTFEDVSNKCLTALITKCPQLEELHLNNCQQFSVEDIEAIARSCPNLKSLTLPHTSSWSDYDWKEACDIRAKAVAQSMHGLRKLRLFDNRITNDGLQAILDGCPNLVLLDLQECRYVDLKGELGKRCIRQIKEMRYHDLDSQVYDYEAIDEWADSYYEERQLCGIFKKECLMTWTLI